MDFIIPGTILKDRDLTMAEKLLFAVLKGVEKGRRYSFETNDAMAELSGLGSRTVCKCVASLEKKGLIQVAYGYVSDGNRRNVRIVQTLYRRRNPMDLQKCVHDIVDTLCARGIV